jgi:hypothetical protein
VRFVLLRLRNYKPEVRGATADTRGEVLTHERRARLSVPPTFNDSIL